MFLSGSFCIVDDVCDDKSATCIYREFVRDKFEFVNSADFSPVFRIYDGRPLRGKTRLDCTVEYTAGNASLGQPNTLEQLLSRIACLARERDIAEESDGRAIELVAWRYVYPMGASLSWHDDSGVIAGFIYYVHRTWRPEWGGELLISGSKIEKRRASDKDGGISDPPFEDLTIRRSVMSEGTGVYIIPKPNRLVFIRSGYPHAIKKVDLAAGNNYRLSIAGFLAYKQG